MCSIVLTVRMLINFHFRSEEKEEKHIYLLMVRDK